MAIQAVIFDMDGVIVDSEPYSVHALLDILQEYGIKPTAEDLQRSYGRRVRDDFACYFRQYGVMADVDAAIVRKHARYYLLAAGHLQPFAGVMLLIADLRRCGYRLGLASSGDRAKIAFGMRALGLDGVFELVVSGDDVTQGKPDPEIYRIVAQRLGVHPAECVVIEDAPAGVQAAKSAGMYCIAVTNTVPREQLRGADLIVNSLEDGLSPLLPRQAASTPPMGLPPR